MVLFSVLYFKSIRLYLKCGFNMTSGRSLMSEFSDDRRPPLISGSIKPSQLVFRNIPVDPPRFSRTFT